VVGIVFATALLAVLTIVTLSPVRFATYTQCPSGLTASPSAPLPTGTVATTARLPGSITASVPASRLVA